MKNFSDFLSNPRPQSPRIVKNTDLDLQNRPPEPQKSKKYWSWVPNLTPRAPDLTKILIWLPPRAPELTKILLINHPKASEQEPEDFLPGDRNSIYFARNLKNNLGSWPWNLKLESWSWRLDAGSPNFKKSASISLEIWAWAWRGQCNSKRPIVTHFLLRVRMRPWSFVFEAQVKCHRA